MKAEPLDVACFYLKIGDVFLDFVEFCLDFRPGCLDPWCERPRRTVRRQPSSWRAPLA
jgi:hypothetical protein